MARDRTLQMHDHKKPEYLDGALMRCVLYRGKNWYAGKTEAYCDLAFAKRAVACLNACEGMADPAAEIARLRNRVVGLERLIQFALDETTHAGEDPADSENMPEWVEHARLAMRGAPS